MVMASDLIPGFDIHVSCTKMLWNTLTSIKRNVTVCLISMKKERKKKKMLRKCSSISFVSRAIAKSGGS